MKKRILLPIGILLCLAVALPTLALAGKGPNSDKKNNGKPKVKISKEFADFPLPFAAEKVPGNKQKAAKGWTEYRVLAFTAKGLVAFYQDNMPGHGWKRGHYKGNTWNWHRGNRTITVVFVQIGPLCLIQVRETKK